MTVCPVGVELFRTDGHADRMTKQIVGFRNFANAPRECVFVCVCVCERERERERERGREREGGRWREKKLMPTLLATRHSIPEFAIN